MKPSAITSPLLVHFLGTVSTALETISGETDHLTGIERIYEDIGAGMDIIEFVPAAIALVELAKRSP